MTENPYSAPQGEKSDGKSQWGQGTGSELDAIVEVLSQTKPWVRLMSVVMFLGGGLMVVAGLFMVLMLVFTGGFEAIFGLVYVFVAIVYIVPAVFLWKYANGISKFVETKSSNWLALSLRAQKSFWKFAGIATLVFIVLYTVFFLVVIFIGVGAAF